MRVNLIIRRIFICCRLLSEPSALLPKRIKYHKLRVELHGLDSDTWRLQCSLHARRLLHYAFTPNPALCCHLNGGSLSMLQQSSCKKFNCYTVFWFLMSPSMHLTPTHLDLKPPPLKPPVLQIWSRVGRQKKDHIVHQTGLSWTLSCLDGSCEKYKSV